MTIIEKEDHHHDHDQSGVTLMWCDNDGQVCLYISIMTMIITVMMIMTMIITTIMIMTMITNAMMIKTMITTAMMNRCDCDSLAADPDSFCSNGEVCKVSVFVIVIFSCDQDKSSFETKCFNLFDQRPGLCLRSSFPSRLRMWPLLQRSRSSRVWRNFCNGVVTIST